MVDLEKNYVFLVGLPRSGSTVLQTILNQRPDVFCTPTSPLLDQLVSNYDAWRLNQAVKANPVQAQLDNITRRIINSIWSHIPQKIIIDKNRGWSSNIPTSTILFGKEIKVIATVRDLPSIMASWLTLLRANPDSSMDKILLEKNLEPNDWNRMEEIWQGMVRECVESFMLCKKHAQNRLLIITYDELINNSKDILSKIDDFIGLYKYNYDLNNIKDTRGNVDDDLRAWGLQGMHTIRSNGLQKVSKPAIDILGEEIFHRFNSIQQQIDTGTFYNA